MSRILLDTSAYSAYRRGDERIREALLDAETVYVSAVVLGELQVGFQNGTRLQENLDELRQFLDKPIVETAFVTDQTAEVYSHVYLDLKRRGTPIPINDVWIAAQCLELGAALVTLDSHFLAVGGLRLKPTPAAAL